MERGEARRIVDGIVLAAGRSRRMGRPKALLPVEGELFVERVVRVLQEGGCRGVVVVVAPGAEEEARRAEGAGAKVVVVEEAAGGEPEQADSLRRGLREVDAEVAGAVVLPVDHALVRAVTVERLLEAFREGDALVVRPVYRGVAGHPTVFARRLFEALSAPGLPEGARTVVEAHAAERVDVPVEDAGVTADVDTPDDYRRLVEGAC